MSWAQIKSLITRNWREKIVAVLLAFLFWFMIKSQTARDQRHDLPLPPMRAI